MRRYSLGFIRPKMEWDEYRTGPTTITCHEPDGVPRRTGLLDARGNPIMATETFEPIGFMPPKEI